MLYPGFAGALVLVAVQQTLIYITSLFKSTDDDKKKK